MKSIRTDLRNRGGVSLFAFQDVIFSVTGVVIVIALLLALQIDKVKVHAEPKGISTDSDPVTASPEHLNALESELADARILLDQLQAARGASVAAGELEAEIATLEARISSRLKASQKLSANLGGLADTEELKSEAVEIARLSFEIQRCREKLHDLTPSNVEKSASVQELEKQVKEVEATVLGAKAKGRELRLIPGKSDTTKEPIVVDVSDRKIIVRRFGRAESAEIRSINRFVEYCSRFKPTEHFFVFFFRPSGTEQFEDLRQAARRDGFEVGYDAIEENTKLKLGRELAE